MLLLTIMVWSSSTLSRVAGYCSLTFTFHYINTPGFFFFFCHFSTDRQLGCFQILAVLNNAATDISVHSLAHTWIHLYRIGICCIMGYVFSQLYYIVTNYFPKNCPDLLPSSGWESRLLLIFVKKTSPWCQTFACLSTWWICSSVSFGVLICISLISNEAAHF